MFKKLSSVGSSLGNFFKAVSILGLTTFRLGKFQVTISEVDGSSHRLTIGEALFALEKVAAAQPGTFTTGTTQITLALYGA